MFPLGFEAHQAASRCFEGAEEVLSIVANLRSEDSLTHVISVFLHKEFGTKLFAHFPSPVWGHGTGVGQWETHLAGILYRWHWISKYLPQFLISSMQLFLFLERLFRGEGGNFRLFWRCFLVILFQIPITTTIACLVSRNPLLRFALESCLSSENPPMTAHLIRTTDLYKTNLFNNFIIFYLFITDSVSFQLLPTSPLPHSASFIILFCYSYMLWTLLLGWVVDGWEFFTSIVPLVQNVLPWVFPWPRHISLRSLPKS